MILIGLILGLTIIKPITAFVILVSFVMVVLIWLNTKFANNKALTFFISTCVVLIYLAGILSMILLLSNHYLVIRATLDFEFVENADKYTVFANMPSISVMIGFGLLAFTGAFHAFNGELGNFLYRKLANCLIGFSIIAIMLHWLDVPQVYLQTEMFMALNTSICFLLLGILLRLVKR